MKTNVYRLIAVAFVIGILLILAGCLVDSLNLKLAGILLDAAMATAAIVIINIHRKSC